jgi:hypothetical protein
MDEQWLEYAHLIHLRSATNTALLLVDSLYPRKCNYYFGKHWVIDQYEQWTRP